MARIIPSGNIYVKTLTASFWWAEYGLEPSFEEDILVCHNQEHIMEVITSGHLETIKQENLKSEEEDLKEAFGKTLDDLLREKVIRSAKNLVFHPAYSIKIAVVRDAVSRYCRDFCGIPFSKIYFVDSVKEEDAKADYQRELQRREATQGKPYKIKMSLEFLEDLFPKEIAGLDIEYGFMKGSDYFVKLKDGSERSIGPKGWKVVK